ncbi:hypothetical protein U9M48_008520 [Paspalum notatum var. saurae]|uniref:Uncharacterized protein n=1 Tax=Paspalum notatum var. saurae TaxID=547442 RepID=A0AAQ3SQ62_PASNO
MLRCRAYEGGDLSLKLKKEESSPLKFFPQDPPLEAFEDLGSSSPPPPRSRRARDPISLPFDFHHLGVVLGASSILGKLDFMGGMSDIDVLMVFMVTMELSCS